MTSYRSGIKDGTAISSSTPYKSNNPLEKKLSKRHKGIETAVKKLTKEESEQIDELSKATLKSYGNKASDQVRDYVTDKPTSFKASMNNMKREKGLQSLQKRKTNEDIDTAKSMHESYKMKFDAALEHYNIKSPSELDESKRKEFFNHVDQEFKKGDN